MVHGGKGAVSELHRQWALFGRCNNRGFGSCVGETFAIEEGFHLGLGNGHKALDQLELHGVVREYALHLEECLFPSPPVDQMVPDVPFQVVQIQGKVTLGFRPYGVIAYQRIAVDFRTIKHPVDAQFPVLLEPMADHGQEKVYDDLVVFIGIRGVLVFQVGVRECPFGQAFVGAFSDQYDVVAITQVECL